MNQHTIKSSFILPLLVSVGLGVFGASTAGAATSVVASILPASRSVQVDSAATLFATIVNAGAEAGVGCRIEVDPALGLSFSYQTTNPITNALVGLPNTPVDLPVGGLQTFVISVSSADVVAASNVVPQFVCNNADPASEIPGVNTFSFAAAAEPVPDIIALGATLSNDGVVVLPDAAGINVFGVATVNVGVSSTVVVSADFGGADLPALISICQTDPSTSQCINPVVPTSEPVELVIEELQTPTFGVFVTAMGEIPFDPANNRAFVRFSDGDGALRGATSVALRLRGPDDALLLSTDNASDALTPGLELQSELFNLSATALLALRRASGSEPFASGGSCFRFGNYSIEARDENGDGLLRAGDGVTVTYNGCSSRLDSDTTYTGELILNLSDSIVSDRGEVRLIVNLLAAGLQVNSSTSGVSQLGANFQFIYTRTDPLELFEIFSTPDNYLSMLNNGDSSRLSGIGWRKVLRTTLNSDYQLSFSASLRSTALNGTSFCEATDLIGTGGTSRFVAPALGEYRCTGADGVSVALDNLGQVLLNTNAGIQLIAGAPGWRDRAPQSLFNGRLHDSDWPSSVVLPDTPLIAELELEVADLVGSSVTGLIYASTEQGVLSFDPGSGAQIDTFAMQGAAGALAVSDDETLLYVGYAELALMQTLDLVTGEFGALQPLGEPPGPPQDPPQEFVAATLAFLPGSRTDVVVGFQPRLRSFQHLGLALFSDGVRATQVAPADARADYVVFHQGRLFGTGDSQLTEFNFSADGITPATTLANFTVGSLWALQSVGDRLVSDLGRVIDFDAKLLAGVYDGFGTGFQRRALSVGVNGDRVYGVSDQEVVVYDAQRYTPLARYETPLDSFDRVIAGTTIGNVMAVASESKLVFIDHRDLIDRPAPMCQTTELSLFYEQTQGVQLQCAFLDFVHDVSRDRIYASTAGRNGANGYSIAVIDDSTGAIEQFIPVGAKPVTLSLSVDGQTLLIGYQLRNTVAYLDLANFTLTESLPLLNTLDDGVQQMTLPLNILSSPTGARDAVANLGQEILGDSRLVLLRETGIAVSDVPRDAPTEFVFADNGRLYGAAGGVLTEFDIDANGLTALRSASGQIFAGRIIRSNNRLYDRSGYRFNLDTFSGSRVFRVPGGGVAVTADDATDAVVFIQNSSSALSLYRSDNESTSFEGFYRPPILGGLNPGRFDGVAKISARLPERYVVLGANGMLFIPKSEVTR